MQETLTQTKASALAWVKSLVPTLPFVVATTVNTRRLWQEQETMRAVSLPAEPGIYLVYLFTEDMPVYIGEADDLRRRLTYQFATNASSNKESTLKKNLLRDKHWDGVQPLDQCFRLRFFTVSFGRTEIEKSLHEHYHVNTARPR